MRIIVGFLILANLALFLLVQRLPGPEAAEPPTVNLPRVTRIEMLNSGSAESSGEGGETDCFRISGFLSPEGARNWLSLAGLPRDRYRITRNGPVQRPLFALIHPEGLHFPRPFANQSTALTPSVFLERAPGGGLRRRFLFPDSGSIAPSMPYGSEMDEDFSLESHRVSFYSFALEGGERVREAWTSAAAAPRSGKLKAESCESIAKPGQNP